VNDYAACLPATEEPNHRRKDRPAAFRSGLLFLEESGYLDAVFLGVTLYCVLLFLERNAVFTLSRRGDADIGETLLLHLVVSG